MVRKNMLPVTWTSCSQNLVVHIKSCRSTHYCATLDFHINKFYFKIFVYSIYGKITLVYLMKEFHNFLVKQKAIQVKLPSVWANNLCVLQFLYFLGHSKILTWYINWWALNIDKRHKTHHNQSIQWLNGETTQLTNCNLHLLLQKDKSFVNGNYDLCEVLQVPVASEAQLHFNK